MNNSKVYAVFDAKVKLFGRPFTDMSDDAAIRNFSDAVNENGNPNNLWAKHPEDFSLFKIGDYNEDLGKLIPCNPESLVTASALTAFNKKPKEIIQ